MLDHSINFRYLTASALKRIGSDRKSDPSDARAGWYLSAYSDEGYTDIVKLTYIDPDAMADIAEYMQGRLRALPASTKRLEAAVKAANSQHEQDRKRGMELLEKRIADDTAMLARMRAEDSK